ncbi:hypothetical protein BH23THE1_BH23THE1_07860 [soil metagenome]
MTTATTTQNHNGLSLRKALEYTGCSRNAYYYNIKKKKKKKEDKKAPKGTKLLLQQQHRQSDEETVLEKKIEDHSSKASIWYQKNGSHGSFLSLIIHLLFIIIESWMKIDSSCTSRFQPFLSVFSA